MIQPTSSFKDDLALMPSIDMLAAIELSDPKGEIVARIDNQPGKQGSLIVYQYLHQEFGEINIRAAQHGLDVFAEHTPDAKARPGAHPNIDQLFRIIDGADALKVTLIAA
ncbi:DUF2322 family protein [Planktotalea sp.]|uniref:DUF2322 family protein n=1 Tax=Planktotalea sp. TaxID=2029877 RepID=UPI0035C80123